MACDRTRKMCLRVHASGLKLSHTYAFGLCPNSDNVGLCPATVSTVAVALYGLPRLASGYCAARLTSRSTRLHSALGHRSTRVLSGHLVHVQIMAKWSVLFCLLFATLDVSDLRLDCQCVLEANRAQLQPVIRIADLLGCATVQPGTVLARC